MLLLCSYRINAQQVLTSEVKGLSNDYITAITKDSKGLIWIGTQKDLFTFDGYTVKEIPFFINMRISCLAYDSMNTVLWIGTNKGLYKLDCNTMQLTDCTAKARARAVTGIVLYQSNVYVSFYWGRIMLIKTNGEVKQIANVYRKRTSQSFSDNRIACDPLGNLYLAPHGYDHILRYNLAENKWKVLPDISLKNARNIMASGNLLLINRGAKGYDVFNMPEHKLLLSHTREININHSITLANHKVYIHDIDRSLLTVSDPVSGEINKMPITLESGKTAKEATCLYVDQNEVIWSGTNRGVIKLVNYRPPGFHELLSEQPQYSIRQMLEYKKNEFYICTYLGLFSYDANRNKLVKIETQLEDGTLLPSARAMVDHEDGYIYFCAESVDQPFYRYDKRKQVFESNFYTKSGSNTNKFFALSLEKDKNGLIWMGTNKGLVSYSNKSHVMQLHRDDKFDPGRMGILYLRKRKNGEQIYGAGNKGIFLLDPEKGITEQINSVTTPALKDEETLFVGDDIEGNTWIGSKKTGIQIISKDRKKVSLITMNDGLSSNEVYSVVWQDPGIAWISTSNGLCRYYKSNKGFNNYFADDGLAGNEFNQSSFLRSSDGTFYFGGTNGVTYFKPDEIPEASKPFSIFSSSILKWNGTSADFSDAELTDNGTKLKMKPSDHLLTFSLGSSDHSFPEKVRFFYNIEGIYNHWLSLGSDHVLRLEGLTAGNHILKIRAYNKDGIPASNILQYSIDIRQAFYKTWWFYALLFFTAAALVYLYADTRIQNLKKLQQLRVQISRNLHDEVGSLLTGIILSADNGRYKSGTMEEKDKRLEKVSSLSRLATDTMSDVLWAIDSSNDHTGDLIDRMREHAEEMFSQSNLAWSFDIKKTDQEQLIKPETRQNLYLIFKESLNNILKHSDADTVQIIYEQSLNKFELIVKNNRSRSRISASQHQGQGLRNMALRAKRVGAVANYTDEGDWFTVHVKSV
jgi:ligand-binding sensor domain-containing protein/two-component sensor histidine kinase